eukprot:scaffold10212_cov127-Amphora_coffeaeformis.AAC.1
MEQTLEGDGGNNFFGRVVVLSGDGRVLAVAMTKEEWLDNIRIFRYNDIGDEYDDTYTIDGWDTGGRDGGFLSLSQKGNFLALGTTSGTSVVAHVFNGNSWQPFTGRVVGESSFHTVELFKDGTTLAVGSISTTTSEVQVYRWTSAKWILFGQALDGDFAINNGCVVSISADGTVLAVGSNSNDGNGENSGHVQVFQYRSNTWVSLGQTLLGKCANDRFGESVALSSDGNILLVGATPRDTT